MKKILATILISGSLVFANDNSIGLDTLVGATIGVAIGNQIGGGNGRDVARVAGGLLGATIANSTRTPSYSNDYYSSPNDYGRSTTYVRNNNYYYDNNRYNAYDNYYNTNRYNSGYRNSSPQVVVIYQDNDRFAPRNHYRHPHRDEPRYYYGR